jgi:hypothetical protein
VGPHPSTHSTPQTSMSGIEHRNLHLENMMVKTAAASDRLDGKTWPVGKACAGLEQVGGPGELWSPSSPVL